MLDEFLTQKEAEKALRCSRATLYRWCTEGKIQAYKLAGGRRLYKKKDLDELVQPIETKKGKCTNKRA